MRNLMPTAWILGLRGFPSNPLLAQSCPKAARQSACASEPSTPKFKSGNIMNMEQRLMLAFKRVVLFGRALFALQRLPKGVEVNYRRLWQCIGQELERSRS
jgi:hypothetical protein